MVMLSRRRLIESGLALSMAATLPRAVRAAERIVLTDPGGSTQLAYVKAFYKPFEQDTGIQVVYAARPNLAMGQLKSMVLANNVEWDVTYLSDYLVEVAVQQDLLDPIDYTKIDPALVAELLPGTASPYMIGGAIFGTVYAYDTKKWPTGQGPQNWSDFWDVRRFPGRRSMVGFGYGPIEQALLADGVPKDKLYPLDLRRAFAKLDEIRPHITVWSTSSAQQHQLLVNQEVDLLQGYANRIQAALADGASYAVQWQDGSYNQEGWVIPKGAKNRAQVLRFIAFVLDANRQAAAFTGSGPTNRLAPALMRPDDARTVPTYPENLAKLYRANAKWLAENQEELQDRWTEWRARRP